MIGIIGGMGPLAGQNLFKCILAQTPAKKDQDHLPVLLWSTPNKITDRSQYLMGKTAVNPAIAVAEIAKQLHKTGVQVIGVPCNTFHSPPIWEVCQQKLAANTNNTLQLINMIDATANTIAHSYQQKTVGMLGTLGTYKYNVYGQSFAKKNINFVVPELNDQREIHQSIYAAEFGIKSTGKITDKSLEIIITAIQKLINREADLILLGCTELSLIPAEMLPKNVLFIDPVKVLAKAMINAFLNIK